MFDGEPCQNYNERCILYEMRTGGQAFPNGETVSDTIAAILARDPDWHAVPSAISPGVLDTRLQRDVALKLLPDHFADDADRFARFQREAQVPASLDLNTPLAT